MKDLGYRANRADSRTQIIFGNGQGVMSQEEICIGPVRAVVVPDNSIVEDLVSAGDIVDSGCKIYQDKYGGHILNPATGTTVKIHRVDKKWTVQLKELEALATPHTIEDSSDIVVLRSSTYPDGVFEKVINLHERMGHPSPLVMINAVDGEHPTWRNTGITGDQIRRVFNKHKCVHCILAKRNRKPISHPSGERAEETRPGDILSADSVGKISPASREGHEFFFIFEDVCTGYLHIFLSKTKVGFVVALRHVVTWYKTRGWTPKVLRTDQGKELMSSEVQAFLDGNQMIPEYSAPYCHWQNSVERDVQTVTRGVSAMLHSQPWLRADCWDLALFHYVACRNRTPNIHHPTKSPFQRIHSESTNLRNTFNFTFGDIVSVSLPPVDRSWKFDLKNDIGIYVGQPEGSVDSSLVYWPFSHSVSERSSLVKLKISDCEFLHYYGRRQEMREKSLPYSVVRDAVINFFQSVTTQTDYENGRLSEPFLNSDDEPPKNLKQKRVRFNDPEVSRAAPSDRTLRSHSAIDVNLIPSRPPNYEEHSSLSAMTAKLTVKKALEGEDSEKWTEAIRKEINMLLDGGTLVAERTSLSGGRYDLIHSTMQLQVKMNDDGSVNKYKARCCARGDELEGKISETYSPTISALTFALVHQLSVIDEMHTCTIDTVGAYLYEDYPEDATPLYLTLAPEVSEACDLPKDITYRVRKYLYGLPDSGRAYYKGYSSHLIGNGYARSSSDPCLFLRFNNEDRTYIWIHVDDTFVASTNPQELDRLQDVLRTKYEITFNPDVSTFLGIHIEKTPGGNCQLSQPKLLKELFEEFRPWELPGTTKALSPMRLEGSRSKNQTEFPSRKYLHLLGILLYLTKTRPEISTAVSFAASKATKPTEGDYEELLHCVKYLYNTREKCLTLIKGKPKRKLILKCYVDASYLTHADSKSHSGYCLSFGDIGTFYSKSSKQTLISTSSTHAEARALYVLIQDIVYVYHLCEELHRPLLLPVIVFEDNQPLIDLSAEFSGKSKRCKHFLMLVHYIREKVEEGLISIEKIPSKFNWADIYTKVVVGNEFQRATDHILGDTSATENTSHLNQIDQAPEMIRVQGEPPTDKTSNGYRAREELCQPTPAVRALLPASQLALSTGAARALPKHV